jgi:hypothetical protein
MTKYTGPADATNACDVCGGPTYTFQSGSVWCPDEQHPGGHFVVRVAFERSPSKPAVTRRDTAIVSASAGAKKVKPNGYMKDGVLTNVYDDPDSSLNVRIRAIKADAKAKGLPDPYADDKVNRDRDDDRFNVGYDSFIEKE